jgi:carbon-monoxide dehydrogenase small subunit
LKLSLRVNGDSIELCVKPHWSLLYVLRDIMGLRAVKYGCGTGECGACSVLLDGRLVNSCLKLAVQCDGSEIVTVEGIGGESKLTPIQQFLVDHGAIQCGYCTPGIVLAATALLNENPHPTIEDVRKALDSNICRCTGYQKIIEAIAKLAEK